MGDSDCGDPTNPDGLWGNSALWGPLVTGNVLMHGFDNHNSAENDYDGLIVNCADFAAAGSGLGLCISIQCAEDNPLAPEGGDFEGTLTIPGMGDFELDGSSGNGIVIVNPGHPAMAGLTDADLDCWGNSVHTHVQSSPAAFEVLAEDNGVDCGDVAQGGDGDPEGGGGKTGPVIIARGSVASILSIPTLSLAALALLAAVLGAVSILVLRRRSRA